MRYGLKTAFCTLAMSGAILAASGEASRLATGFAATDNATTDTVGNKTAADAPANENSIIDRWCGLSATRQSSSLTLRRCAFRPRWRE